MAQYAIFAVNAIPAVGTTTHAAVYRGDHADEAAAVAAGAIALGLSQPMHCWAVATSALTAYTVDVTNDRIVALE
jgi:hypothetical protein